MFKKQYNNNFLFIALIIILFTVIAVFAYLIMKANQGKQEQSDANSIQSNLKKNSADVIIDDVELPDDQKEIEPPAGADAGAVNTDPDIIVDDVELPDDQK